MDSILQSGRGGLIRETKLPMQELELKMQGGLMREGGGVIAGFYGIYMYNVICDSFIINCTTSWLNLMLS